MTSIRPLLPIRPDATHDVRLTISEITGGSPYGSSTITGGKGERLPSANELAIARFQGKHTAQIAAKLAKK